MIVMKVTNTKTQKEIKVKGESIREAAEMLVQSIIKEGWRGENLRFDMKI